MIDKPEYILVDDGYYQYEVPYEAINWFIVNPPDSLTATMIYTQPQIKLLADKAQEEEEKKTGKELSEEEKERLWNLIKSAVEGG